MRKIIFKYHSKKRCVRKNHVCFVYTELPATLRIQDGTTALCAVAETFSLSGKLIKDSFVVTHKACTVKILGFFFFNLAQVFLTLPSVVINPPLSHCRLCFHRTPYLEYPKFSEMWKGCPDRLQWN